MAGTQGDSKVNGLWVMAHGLWLTAYHFSTTADLIQVLATYSLRGSLHAFYVDCTLTLSALTRSPVIVNPVYSQCRSLGLACNWRGNWSDIYRDFELVATGPVSLERLYLYPEVNNRRVRVQAAIDGFKAGVGQRGRILKKEVCRLGLRRNRD